MKVRLSNGMTIDGTYEQVTETANKLGLTIDMSGWYLSENKGMILISTMDIHHLKNAILKMYKAWVDSLYLSPTTDDFITQIRNGNEDKTFKELLIELYSKSGRF